MCMCDPCSCCARNIGFGGFPQAKRCKYTPSQPNLTHSQNDTNMVLGVWVGGGDVRYSYGVRGGGQGSRGVNLRVIIMELECRVKIFRLIEKDKIITST